ncbi:MAG: YfhO family protein [Muribaculaceae bacterium]|nr:YfhO family protein [Muribaculaceae bacterium]
MREKIRAGRPILYYGIVCAAAAFLTSALAFLPHILKSGGALTLVSDFNFQQIPFEMAAGDALKNWDGEWLWSLDLGTSLVNGFSFYNLGSPFMWLIFLFGKSCVPYLMAPVFVLKYIVAAVASYRFMCYFVNDKRYAVIGGILYAFCGFQNYNLVFFHFHDAVAMFPLMLTGLEKFMRERRKAPFAAAVMLNCLTNYFFFFGEVLFLMAYYIIRHWGGLKRRIREIAGCFGLGAAGVLGAGVLFVPAVIFILTGSRVAMVPAGRNFVEFYLRNLKGFLFPVDIMGGQFVLNTEEWWSTSCYLPLAGIVFAVAWCVKNYRHWLAKLAMIFTVVSFVIPLNSLFYLFAEYEFKRWWYMYVLFLALISVKAMDEKIEWKYLKIGCIANVSLIGLFWLLTLPLAAIGAVQGVNDAGLAVINTILAAAMPCAACRISMHGLPDAALRQGLAVAACAGLCLTSTIGLYRQETNDGADMLGLYRAALNLDTGFADDGQYRMDTSSNSVTLVSGVPGLVSFCSTVSDPIAQFYARLDVLRAYSGPDPHIIPGLVELLGGKYHVSTVAPKNMDGAIAVSDGGNVSLYITEQEACPIGFRAGKYMLESELLALDVMDRAVAMLDHVIVTDDDEQLVSGTLSHDGSPNVSDGMISTYVSNAEQNKVSDFSRGGHGFSCRTDYDADSVVFFSVPNDAGWTAYVDGVETDTIDAIGLTALAVPAGTHDIRFAYHTPGLDAGMLCSAAGAIAIFGLAMADIMAGRKKNDGRKDSDSDAKA